MGGLINPSILNKNSFYRKQFLNSKPFRHLMIQNFFNSSLTQRLRSSLEKESLEIRRSQHISNQFLDLFRLDNLLVKNWIIAFYEEMIPWIENITQVQLARLHTALRFYVYRKSDYLGLHTDNVFQRAVAFVINLSNFKANEGGRLLLMKKNRMGKLQISKRLPQIFNSIVLFEINSRSLHQLEEIKTERRRLTISGWLYKREYDYQFVRHLKHLAQKKN